jgi:RimJ/RimL family protein N-acetyltransferase
MNPAVTILPTTEAHIDGFWRTLDVVAREEEHLGSTEAAPIAKIREFVLNGIAKDDPLFVAVAEDKVIGWIDITRRKDDPTQRHVGQLGMGILEAFRGQGIGSGLMQSAMDKARAIEMKRVELQVYTHNYPAIALYRKFKFIEEGQQRALAFLRGRYVDALQMAWLDDSLL